VDYTVEPLDYSLDHGKLKGGKIIHHLTGSEILTDLQELKELIEKSPGGIWFLGDRLLLNEGYYSMPMEEHLRSLVGDPDYVGRDGQTFAVKVR
jgi:hypothetical protein